MGPLSAAASVITLLGVIQVPFYLDVKTYINNELELVIGGSW